MVTYVTARPNSGNLVPVGYGDGYHRILSNKGRYGADRAPIIGRLWINSYHITISQVQQDDEVVLVGRQEEEIITAEEVASWRDRGYEITTALLPRGAKL
jgi:alanine racemase